MRRLLSAGFVLFLSAGAALATPDPSRCPVSQALMDANVTLHQSNVSVQANGTLVTCIYRSMNAVNFGTGLGFPALCPDGQRIRFPGFLFDQPFEAFAVRALLSKELSDGTELAEITVHHRGVGGKLGLTVVAHCEN